MSQIGLVKYIEGAFSIEEEAEYLNNVVLWSVNGWSGEDDPIAFIYRSDLFILEPKTRRVHHFKNVYGGECRYCVYHVGAIRYNHGTFDWIVEMNNLVVEEKAPSTEDWDELLVLVQHLEKTRLEMTYFRSLSTSAEKSSN